MVFLAEKLPGVLQCLPEYPWPGYIATDNFYHMQGVSSLLLGGFIYWFGMETGLIEITLLEVCWHWQLTAHGYYAIGIILDHLDMFDIHWICYNHILDQERFMGRLAVAGKLWILLVGRMLNEHNIT